MQRSLGRGDEQESPGEPRKSRVADTNHTGKRIVVGMHMRLWMGRKAAEQSPGCPGPHQRGEESHSGVSGAGVGGGERDGGRVDWVLPPDSPNEPQQLKDTRSPQTAARGRQAECPSNLQRRNSVSTNAEASGEQWSRLRKVRQALPQGLGDAGSQPLAGEGRGTRAKAGGRGRDACRSVCQPDRGHGAGQADYNPGLLSFLPSQLRSPLLPEALPDHQAQGPVIPPPSQPSGHILAR